MGVVSTSITATTQWETEVVRAWGREPDCTNGMCRACGLGATVVEIANATNTSAKTSIRSIMTGPNGQKAPVNYDTATFEIASYTKHFTALAMVFMEKEIDQFAQTTLRDILPCQWDNHNATMQWDPYQTAASITLEELRLHTSGLPPQAPNHELAGRDGNPFADYTEDMLCDSLLALTGLPTRGRFLYSNYAYGLLGYALTLAAKLPSYEALMKKTVLDPLGMTHTSVTLDRAGWKQAAKGCNRGLERSKPAMRRAPYGVLQGNGALRSTLPDMAKFLEASLLVVGGFVKDMEASFTPMQETLYEAVHRLGKEQAVQQEACTCVSGWCEGNLCHMPNPVQEKITDSGLTIYTSGGIVGRRKSGDTEGYSVRGAWSGQKGRAVFVVDTCGGCGERGTSGSAAQRVALILADGPPPPPSAPTEDSPVLHHPHEKEQVYRFTGVSDSHVYPSLAYLEVEVHISGDGRSKIAVASSDGAGCAVPARQLDGRQLQWEFDSSVLYGCGFGGDDPLATLPQRQSLRMLKDGTGAILQEMGEDIYLKLTPTPHQLDWPTLWFSTVAIVILTFLWFTKQQRQ